MAFIFFVMDEINVFNINSVFATLSKLFFQNADSGKVLATVFILSYVNHWLYTYSNINTQKYCNPSSVAKIFPQFFAFTISKKKK